MALELEKTHYFTLEDGTNILVSHLPDSIKEQVKIYDEIRENFLQKSFEAQVYNLASEQKRLQLKKMLENYLTSEETESKKDHTDTRNAVDQE